MSSVCNDDNDDDGDDDDAADGDWLSCGNTN